MTSFSSSVIYCDNNARFVIDLLRKRVSKPVDTRLINAISSLAEISEDSYVKISDLEIALGANQARVLKYMTKLADAGLVQKNQLREHLRTNDVPNAESVNFRFNCYLFTTIDSISSEILDKYCGQNIDKKTASVGRARKKLINTQLNLRNIDDLSSELRSQIVTSKTTTYLSYPMNLDGLIAPADDILLYKESLRFIEDDISNTPPSIVTSLFGITNNFDLKTLNSLKLITLQYLEMKSKKLGYPLALEEAASIEIPAYIADLCALHGLSSNKDDYRRDISSSLLRISESTYVVPKEDAQERERFRFLQDLTTIGDKDIKHYPTNTDIQSAQAHSVEAVNSLIDRSYGDSFPFVCVTFRWTFRYFERHIFNAKVTKLDAQVTRLRATIYAIFYALYNDCKSAHARFSFIKSNNNKIETNLLSLIQFTWSDADIDTQRHLCKKILMDLHVMVTYSKERVSCFEEMNDGTTRIELNLFGFTLEFLIPNFTNKNAIASNLNSAVTIVVDVKELNKHESASAKADLTTFLPARKRRKPLVSDTNVKRVLSSLDELKRGTYSISWSLGGESYLISLYHTEEELKAVYMSVASLLGCAEVDVRIALDHYLNRLKKFSGIDQSRLMHIANITLLSKSEVIRYLTLRTRLLKRVSTMSDIEIEDFFGII